MLLLLLQGVPQGLLLVLLRLLQVGQEECLQPAAALAPAPAQAPC
jgi:hypothetical protein